MARVPELSSTELVKACAVSKDYALWFEFIRRFQPVIATAVLRTASSWGNASPDVVDDLIQDTYLKLCADDSRMLRNFIWHSESSIFGFLKTVGANTAHDHFKSTMAAKRGVSQTQTLREPLHHPKTFTTDGLARVNNRLQIQEIDEILRLVTAGRDQDRKCTIFWLRHRLGLTASEIASIPGIGLSTAGVESLLMRLASMIRSHLVSESSLAKVKVFHRQSRSKRMGT